MGLPNLRGPCPRRPPMATVYIVHYEKYIIHDFSKDRLLRKIFAIGTQCTQGEPYFNTYDVHGRIQRITCGTQRCLVLHYTIYSYIKL